MNTCYAQWIGEVSDGSMIKTTGGINWEAEGRGSGIEWGNIYRLTFQSRSGLKCGIDLPPKDFPPPPTHPPLTPK